MRSEFGTRITQSAVPLTLCLVAYLVSSPNVVAHEHTLEGYLIENRRTSETEGASHSEGVLEIEVFDELTRQPLYGLVKVTNLASGRPVRLERFLERPMNWYATPPHATYSVPRGRIRVEACHGIETEIFSIELDFSQQAAQSISLPLRRFYEPSAHELRAGNTHLHLICDEHRKMGVQLESRAEADHYLQTVGQADGLDIVYVSYLTRPEKTYVSNDYKHEDLHQLSSEKILFVNGEEYRHQGGIDSENTKISYGHVMFLDIPRLILPASIGPGLSENPATTDGIPLRTGIEQIRADGGTVVWCHGLMGTEALPDWIDGLLHAQNIFDGGNEGTIDEVYYPLLNIGMKIPFSTGTDWGIWDFSRVYVPVAGDLASKSFLAALKQGNSFITNGTFLEFEVEGRQSGETIVLEGQGKIKVHARAIGREDFLSLQLVLNGNVIHEVSRKQVAGHYEAELEQMIQIDEPGWLAARIPTDRQYDIRSRLTGSSTNILGKTLFAHTSPIYVSVAGHEVYQPEAARILIARLQASIQEIRTKGVFRSADDMRSVMKIYNQALEKLIAEIESRVKE